MMASLTNYPCFCNSGAFKRFESKTGRGFYEVYKSELVESCPLLIPEERHQELTEAFEMRVHKPNNFTLCHL